MAIPEAQLETWCKQGSVAQSRDTYATVKAAREASETPYADKTYTSFLQGSYGNDTNIYSDSDVDVVMRLDSIYYYDISRLTPAEDTLYKSATGDGTYTLAEFKKQVVAQLLNKFGSAVKPGSKAIFIAGNGNRRDADVLVAAQFRRYFQFSSLSSQRYAEGICFFLADGTRVENFPKQHSDNSTQKHGTTNQWFKPTVRIFKNMRNRMINDKLIAEGVAPSYYLEGMLYNVPDSNFGGTFQDMFLKCFNWVWNADKSQLTCAHGYHWLVRDGSATSWPTQNCAAFLDAAAALWKGWSSTRFI